MDISTSYLHAVTNECVYDEYKEPAEINRKQANIEQKENLLTTIIHHRFTVSQGIS